MDRNLAGDKSGEKKRTNEGNRKTERRQRVKGGG